MVYLMSYRNSDEELVFSKSNTNLMNKYIMEVIMKKTTLFAIMLTVFVFCFESTILAQVPNFGWAKKGSGTLRDNGLAIAVDQAGNSYVTGEFFSTALNFAPSLTLTMAGGSGNCDFFLAKFDPLGNAIWGFSGGGTLTDRGYGVAIDNQGKVIVTGHYFGTATFGTYTLTSAGNLDCFTAKFDTSGNILWLKEGKNGAQLSTRGVGTDNAGNSVIVGYYGSATAPTATFDGVTVTTNGIRDAFVVKYNSEGVAQWGKSIGGLKTGEQANSVAIDNQGNVYVTGIYTDTASFDGVTLNGNGGAEIFIVKYSASGSLIWAKTAGGAKADEGASIALDGLGGLYISGKFDSAATFGTTNIVGFGTGDAYLAKYDVNGNFQWVRYGGGTGNDYMNAIAIDRNNNIMGFGQFTGTATFGPNVLTSLGLDDLYFIKCDPNGNLIWIKQAGGSDADKGNCMALDPAGNAYGTGSFKVYAKFEADSLVSAGVEDVYVAKLGNSIIPVELGLFTAENSDGFVTLRWSTITETNNYGFDIERSNDGVQFEKIVFINGNGTKTSKTDYLYTDKNISASKYYYRLKQIDFDGSISYSKTIEIDGLIEKRYNLNQNYPNPFNPSTSISFDLGKKSNISLSVFNSLGELVYELNQNELETGRHTISFNGTDLTSGIYMYQLKVYGENGTLYSDSKKMMLIK